jgi:hypothetical protein
VAGPGDQALAWAAQAVAPGARVTRAAGLREGGYPWLLRLDAALYHGPGTASQILDAWRQATGREPEHVAYWDVVAALTTVGDMARCLPPLTDHHRPTLPRLSSPRAATHSWLPR